jgi:threonine dehydratase
LLEGKIDAKGKRVGAILSGGNVDVVAMAAMIRSP